MNTENEFFENDAEVAQYLGMTLPAFLGMRNRGKFGVAKRPRDPEQVYWRSDVSAWLAAGKPVSNQSLAGRTADFGVRHGKGV